VNGNGAGGFEGFGERTSLLAVLPLLSPDMNLPVEPLVRFILANVEAGSNLLGSNKFDGSAGEVIGLNGGVMNVSSSSSSG
jgi:hypothetical protein